MAQSPVTPREARVNHLVRGAFRQQRAPSERVFVHPSETGTARGQRHILMDKEAYLAFLRDWRRGSLPIWGLEGPGYFVDERGLGKLALGCRPEFLEASAGHEDAAFQRAHHPVVGLDALL